MRKTATDEAAAAKLRLGTRVMLALLALDGIEYAVGSRMKSGALLPLLAIALVSTWLIARTYMHIQQLRRGGEH